jgi:hypothetical protein
VNKTVEESTMISLHEHISGLSMIRMHKLSGTAGHHRAPDFEGTKNIESN